MIQIYFLFNSVHNPINNVASCHKHDDTKGMDPFSEQEINNRKCCCVKHCTTAIATYAKAGFHVWKLGSIINYLYVILVPPYHKHDDTNGMEPLLEGKTNNINCCCLRPFTMDMDTEGRAGFHI